MASFLWNLWDSFISIGEGPFTRKLREREELEEFIEVERRREENLVSTVRDKNK